MQVIDTKVIVSSSLITNKPRAPLSKEDQKLFCLGLDSWCPCDNCGGHIMESVDRSTTKSSTLSLKLKRKRHDVSNEVTKEEEIQEETFEPCGKMPKVDDRFLFDVTLDDLNKFKEGDCPVNTAKNTMWALRNFQEWRVARNEACPNDLCPGNILCSDNKEDLCDWLCKFVTETRKSDGAEYTPRSLYLLLSGLQRHIRQVKSEEINIFQDTPFKPLKNVCNSIFKKLHAKGIGTELKATPVISINEEEKLWEKKILDLDSPMGLLRAVFFYNGKHFCLRGGQEQRQLKLSQFVRETTMVDGKRLGCYTYTEFGSKNHQGGFNSLNVKNKVVKQYENISNPQRCHVKMLDKYFEFLPKEAWSNNVFYLTPLSKMPTEPGKPWFTKTPVGRNRLNSMLKEMCKEAQIDGKFTNHSLRAYGATKLFQSNVPEKLIQQRTGHRSLDALRQYERTTESQLVDVSNVISNRSVAVPKMSNYQPSTNNVKTANDSPATIVFKGCTFTACAVSMSGQATNENQSVNEHSIQELLRGIDVHDIYDD